MEKAQYWIDCLKMNAHPEGGYYKEVYRSPEIVDTGALPKRYTAPRSFATSIYFLLDGDTVSNFHRLKSDELWYYHQGSPLTVYMIHANGQFETLRVGPNHEKGERLQVIIPAGTIFGSAVDVPESFSLVGCMVAPGFDFEDFELFEREPLMQQYPQHEKIIARLTPAPKAH